MRLSQGLLLGAIVTACAATVIAACGARTGLSVPLFGIDAGPCTSPTLVARMHTCDGGTPTTISGAVYDPAARNPVFNVVVYVPGSTPQPLKLGASCDTCSDLYTGDPIATALTDSAGRFRIANVPDGDNIPLVVQVGKWRRQYILPTVTACQDNPQPDRSLTLPKNHAEGDIPNIAVSTGAADTLECLLSRVGLDASEYGGGADGPGHIHIFRGGVIPGVGPDGPLPPQLPLQCDAGPSGRHAIPNTTPSAPISSQALWDSTADIMRYDIVLLSCEGGETAGMNQQVLFDYAAAGGRIFASHYHYSWFDSGPFGAANLATWARGANPIQPLSCDPSGVIEANIVTRLPSGQPFPGGEAMQRWLGNDGALTDGGVPIENARQNAVVGPSNTASQTWVAAGPNSQFSGVDGGAIVGGGEALYLSFNTPLSAAPANQCGQVIFSDLHVSGTGDNPSQQVPLECARGDLSPQEKILEFMLFDLSSCVTPRGVPPAPPSVCPQP